MSNTTDSPKKGTKVRMDVTGKLPMTGNVFVYGTLKRAYWNNRLLKGAKFIGEAITTQPYPMVCGGIPYLFNIPGKGHVVQGEIFEVTDPEMMANLDRLESHPHGYIRTPLKVLLNGTTETDVFVYFFSRSDFRDEMLKDCKPIYVPPHGY